MIKRTMQLKEMWLYFWYRNYYDMFQFRNHTTETGNSKNKYSYEEFKTNTGITVEEYDSNVDLYKDMKYKDVVEYLKNNKPNDSDNKNTDKNIHN